MVPWNNSVFSATDPAPRGTTAGGAVFFYARPGFTGLAAYLKCSPDGTR